MMSDLTLVDFLYAVIGTSSLIGLLIWTTTPPDPPVSVRARNRLRLEQEETEQ